MRIIEEKIVLRGHVYAAPKTESVEITNQGVLCGSGAQMKAGGTIKGWN